ncbi:hypothetical protein NMG60_11004061 [Bertholletia excelsa]
MATQTSGQRGVAAAVAMASAVVLSPLYVTRKNENRFDTRWSSGFVLPMVLAGLIIAIKTTSSGHRAPAASASAGPSRVLRIGSSSWGLAGILVMLILVLSWQDSVRHFFRR